MREFIHIYLRAPGFSVCEKLLRNVAINEKPKVKRQIGSMIGRNFVFAALATLITTSALAQDFHPAKIIYKNIDFVTSGTILGQAYDCKAIAIKKTGHRISKWISIN